MPTAHETLLAELREHFGARVRAEEPLARHGTFGVGGPAEAWVTVQHEHDLQHIVTGAATHGWPLMLLGNGTNVLFADAGARGIVARMALDTWRLEPLDATHARLEASAGVSLPRLVNALAAEGWAGLEWGAGVPGTIGGAIVSNAGAHGACTADTVETVRTLIAPAERGAAPEVRTFRADELALSYRHSRFRAARRITFDDEGRPTAAPRAPIEPREMITSATFLLRREPPADVLARVAHYRQHRRETQPPQPSAGSVFANPAGDYAGRLIEAAGLRGQQIGQAQISPRHANFIVNLGGATAAQIVSLIALARRTVRERFGIALELEVELRGDW